jgi:TetR/AcrR family transcriptional regulator, regulator of cefoperazone and chloramphenicol sensitivity
MNAPAPHTPVRADGALARQRLLDAALRLFAEKGFQKTSTRVIADTAGVNLGAISYYFGDKARLYQAVFCESFSDVQNSPDSITARGCLPDFRAPGLDIEAALAGFFRNFLQPLKLGEQVRLVMRLHFRELVEPSGALPEGVDADIGALYFALAELAAQRLGISAADPDARRLAHAILGLAVHFFVTQDLVGHVSPELVATPEAIDTLAERLATYAVGMLDAEVRRRHPTGSPS